MYFFLLTGLEDRNRNRLPGLRDVLQENEWIHPGLQYRLYLLHSDKSLMVTKGNRLNNVYEHLFRQEDATSAGHLLPEIVDLQKEQDAPSGDLVWYELRPLHPATGRENRMLRPIDNIHCVPRPGMPEFDIKAIRLQERLLTDRVFLSERHQEYGSNIARLLPARHMQDLISEIGV